MAEIRLECKLARNYNMENVDRAQALLLVKAIPDKTIDFGTLPLNLALVIDVSGSMRGKKLMCAKEAACQVVDSLSSQDWLSVTVFNDDAEVMVPARKVDDKNFFFSKIESMKAHNKTCMYAGMRAGAQEIARQASPLNISRMLLLTDGKTEGESECLNIARSEAERKFVISTFGIGETYNEDLLKALSEITLGGAYHLEDPGQIQDNFKTELKVAAATGVSGTSLIFQLTGGVTLEEVHRITPHIAPLKMRHLHDRTFVVDIGDLEKSESTAFGAKLTLPNRQTSRVRIAQVTLRYDIPSLQVRDREQRIDVIVEYTKDRQLCGKVDSQVVSYFMQLNVQSLVEQATCKAKAGNVAGATQKLVQAHELTRRIGNVVMTTRLEQAMDELEKKGTVSAGTVKTIRLGSTHTVRIEETDRDERRNINGKD